MAIRTADRPDLALPAQPGRDRSRIDRVVGLLPAIVMLAVTAGLTLVVYARGDVGGPSGLTQVLLLFSGMSAMATVLLFQGVVAESSQLLEDVTPALPPISSVRLRATGPFIERAKFLEDIITSSINELRHRTSEPSRRGPSSHDVIDFLVRHSVLDASTAILAHKELGELSILRNGQILEVEGEAILNEACEFANELIKSIALRWGDSPKPAH